MFFRVADAATIQTRLDTIEEILAAGESSVRLADGRMTTYDLVALAKERDRLQATLAAANSSQFRRVVFKNG